MQGNRLKDVDSQLIPVFGIREDAVAESSGVEAALIGIANLEDKLHEFRIPKPRGPTHPMFRFHSLGPLRRRALSRECAARTNTTVRRKPLSIRFGYQELAGNEVRRESFRSRC